MPRIGKREIRSEAIDVFKVIAHGITPVSSNKVVWEQEPVDVVTFIEDKHFLNMKWNGKTGCRPIIKDIIKAVVDDKVREAMLLMGKGCLSGKTIIWTKDGPRKMKELVGKRVTVQSRDEVTYKPIWNTGLCLSRGIQKLRRYKFDNGMCLDMTDIHNIIVAGVGKIHASDMKIGQYMSAPRKLLRPEESKYTNPLLYRLTGLLIGDGTILDYKINLTNCEPKVQEQFVTCVNNIDPNAKISYHVNGIDLYIPKMFIRGWGNRSVTRKGKIAYIYKLYDELGLLNCKAKDKHIPEMLMNGSYDNICELLSGLFSTDGWFERKTDRVCYEKNLPKLFYASKSKKLLKQIKLLLLRLGIVATVVWKLKSVKPRSCDKRKKKWYGSVEISGYEDLMKVFENLDITRPNTFEMENIVRRYAGLSMKPLDQIPLAIAKECGMKSKGKTGVARYRFAKENINGGKYLNIHWVKLVSIEDRKEEEVFDIICANPNHNYCANGLYPENSGKDFSAAIIHAYGIYKCLCMYSPQEYFGLAPGSPIYFTNTARNDEQAKRVFFILFKNMILNCPAFEGHYREPGMQSIEFDKNIFALSANSQAYSWLGFNTLQWVGDELAFFLSNDSNEESASRANECWEAAYGSCQTRFPHHYKMIGITSPRYDDDFVMQKFYELQSRPDGYTKKAATWDVNPNLTKEDFAHAFARDYRRAMRDFGAEPSGVIESFWADPEFIDVNPCEICRQCPIWQNRKTQNTTDECCWEYEKCKANSYMGGGEWREELLIPDKDAEYFMHFDLSQKKDRLGFAMAHVVDWVAMELDGFQIQQKAEKQKTELGELSPEDKVEEKPLILVDFLGWIDPRNKREKNMLKNGEIYYSAVFNRIIVYIKEKGFNIQFISFDQFQSLSLKQNVIDLGIESELLSLDRTDEVPSAAKIAFIENRVFYPWCRPLANEAKYLKYIKGNKVDHARSASKDLFDACAGAIFNAEKRSGSGGGFVDLDQM